MDNDKNITINKDNDQNPLYNLKDKVYLNSNELEYIKTFDYNGSKIYKFERTPITIFKTNELIFENSNKEAYKDINLITNVEATCSEFNGKYFIFI